MAVSQLLQSLENAQLITHSVSDRALTICKEQGIPLFRVLLENQMLPEEKLLPFLAEQFGYPFEKIDTGTIDTTTSHLIPENFARQNLILPLFQVENTLTVALWNPFDVPALESAELLTSFSLNPILTLKKNLQDLLDYCYSTEHSETGFNPEQVDSLFEMGMKLIGDTGVPDDASFDLAEEAPIAKLVNTIFRQALEMHASDIHIEPEEKVVKVRFRVDGLLRDIMMPPKKLEPAILSRLKILANLDITERRKPQDGRISLNLKDREIDIRVSTVATIHGEKMVLRILDKAGFDMSIENLGMSAADVRKFQQLIYHTSGILMVCGPTGSGKTTTLYSALTKVNTPEKNIITIEDPVEYSLDGITQIPVNDKIGVDFAHGLSAIVRQDPDIIMVGEIRDAETATIAIQSALTGHLVLTTLHTRNAPGALTRLVDMGIEPFLISSAVIGVVGQRLIRRLCPHCRKPVNVATKTSPLIVDFVNLHQDRIRKDAIVYDPGGCKFCDDSGYKGRVGLYEI
ncbi:MAG: GspE/PulE family protein, partial [Candidatus Margulisiibacteriota bacterium]